MTSAAPERRYSFREYVELEASSATRFEFYDGTVYAMSGGSPEHSGLAANVIQLLGAQLIGKPGRVFTPDRRVRVLETGLAAHPDVSAICGSLERDPEDANTATNPVVVVEVLSPSTQRYDREEKAAHYRRLIDHDEEGSMETKKREGYVRRSRPPKPFISNAPSCGRQPAHFRCWKRVSCSARLRSP